MQSLLIRPNHKTQAVWTKTMAHDAPLSPLAPPSYPDLPQIDGVSFAAGEGGIRYKGRTDVMIAPVSYTHLTLPTNREV